VIRGAERTRQFWFGSIRDPIEDVDVEPALHTDQCRQQSDRPRTRHERGTSRPRRRTPANPFRVVPCLCDDARRLEQNAQVAETCVDLDGERRFEAKAFRAVTVTLLDAALGVAPIAAHVPFAHGAIPAGHRIRTAHDADDEIIGVQAGPTRGIEYTAE
jgi:hypothetical protein